MVKLYINRREVPYNVSHYRGIDVEVGPKTPSTQDRLLKFNFWYVCACCCRYEQGLTIQYVPTELGLINVRVSPKISADNGQLYPLCR